MSYILDSYSDDDFSSIPPNVMKAAEGFIDNLNDASGYESAYVKIVPCDHINGVYRDDAVAIIYEEVCDLAEKIQLGYESVMPWHIKLNDIQNKNSAFVEMYNHWSCFVYDDK